MKKLVCGILMLVLCLCSAAAAQEIVIPEVAWTFPVPLTDVQSEYAMLVNTDNLLDKSFVPDPLIKVTGIKRATSAAVYLEETAANALKEMFAAAGDVTDHIKDMWMVAKGSTSKTRVTFFDAYSFAIALFRYSLPWESPYW